MSRRFFDHDAITGVTEYFHYDQATGDGFIEMVEDETALVEANKAEFNLFTAKTGFGKGDELTYKNRVLRLSATMTQKLQQRGILNDPVLLMAWADTDEAIPYRTRPGRLRGTGQHV